VKGTRHSEEQIIAILKQGEAELATAQLCRQHGISEQTYYRWKAKYGRTESGDASPGFGETHIVLDSVFGGCVSRRSSR
jgi:transposase-like protein